MRINPDHVGQDKFGKYAHRAIIQYEADDFHPSSMYWRGFAVWSMEKLYAEVFANDQKDYQQWVEDFIPEDATFRDIHEIIEAFLLGMEIA